jgi:4-amino-4-deoxy-L-arabinose transferase-like glycosyltransferase
MSGERGEIGRLRFAREVWLTSAAVVVLELLVSARYGFHRDELYFLVAGRRLDWGFVDQPPLTPLLARISEMIGGTSTVAIRVLPALAVGAVVLVAAATARRFGAGRRAQWLSGLMAGGTGYALAVGHLMSTAAFDYLLWTVALWLLVGLLDGDEPRRWALLGVVVGIGMQNKHLIAFLAVAVLIAIVGTSQRRILAGVWPWVGALLAILIALPNLIWQAANSFPQLEMADALAARSDGPIAFVLEQVGLLSIVLVVPLAAGLWRLLRSREMLRWRPIGIAFVLLFVFFLVSGGKSYYVAGMYPVLLAAGARWFDDLSPGKQQGMVRSAGVGIAIGTLIALPILPVAWVADFDATGELGETAGWPELIDQIDGVYQSIPADLRSGTVIFTGSYGEAGAVDVLGPDRGLPAASSGHNSYWLWGPPDTHGPIIGVGGVGETLRAICPMIQQVGTISNPWEIGNEEMGLPLWLCDAPRGQLADIWPDVKHYN